MITFDALLYLLAGASLPAAYLFFVSRWIESEAAKLDETVLAPGEDARTIARKCIPAPAGH